MGRVVRIGNGQGFWGDSVDAPLELLTRGPLDYLGMDYLAEVTLSIMMRQKLRDPHKGYATDFIAFLRRALPVIAERGVKVVTNAGGLNPPACREEVFEVARELGISGLKVGVVEGDDLLPRIGELCGAGHHLEHMETGKRLCEVRHKVLSANAYLGARPVAAALAQGAQIVLAGRITDTSLALGPLVHEFGWPEDDWDLLAGGTVAGHIIECGAQATGGNFSRWWEVPDLWDVGYPVLEFEADGSFVVTKHPGTGGLVTTATVAEQLVYEMGDPRAYITPDCVADFTSAQLQQEGERPRSGARHQGLPRTPFFKVSASYLDGWKASGQLVISGPRAVEKARLAAEVVWKRLARAGVSFPEEDRVTEMLGTGACHPGLGDVGADPPEVVLRLAVRDAEPRRVSIASARRSRRWSPPARRGSPASPAAAPSRRRSSPTGRRSSPSPSSIPS